MLASALLLVLVPAGFAQAAPPPKFNFKNLVTFGDSYTDVVWTGEKDYAWPTYATGYAKATLFPYARAGGTCSNNVAYRPFPSVSESQVPLFAEQLRNGTVKLKQSETLYTLWIGTNDLGAAALLTGDNAPGVSIVDTSTCAVNVIKTLYKLGARNFLFQNIVPLELVPMYTRDAYYNRYWTYARNSTAWSISIAGLAKAGNALASLQLQDLAPQLPGAHVGLFDSHALFTELYKNPAKYFNGTDPVNVKRAISACVFPEGGASGTEQCTTVAKGPARDSYLWYDELHPSEQADRNVAREIVAAARGSTRYTHWFS